MIPQIQEALDRGRLCDDLITGRGADVMARPLFIFGIARGGTTLVGSGAGGALLSRWRWCSTS